MRSTPLTKLVTTATCLAGALSAMWVAGCTEAIPPTPARVTPETCEANEDCGIFETCVEGVCEGTNTNNNANNVNDANNANNNTDPADAGVDAGVDVGTDATVDDADDPPGVGDPCNVGEDCPSGYCVETAEGVGNRICTDFCADDASCPEDYTCAAVVNGGQDRVFLCFPARDILCQPCEGDGDCGGLSDRCLDYVDGRFCGRSCDLQVCPTGYDCVEVEGPDGPGGQCRAATDQCTGCFDPDNDGYGVGSLCEGLDCAPMDPTVHEGADDLCNGVDDDCDNAIDEGNPGGGAACNTGEDGVCATGTLTCVDGVVGCVRQQDPGVEVCNGLDDDCDSIPDNDPSDTGATCATGALGVCDPGTMQCQAGALACVSDVTARAEVCNGLDDNCDGADDNAPVDVGEACDTGEDGICAAGTTVCSTGAPSCVRDAGPATEVCNGLDDDCDGIPDNNVNGTGGDCTVPGGLGVCAAGARTCVDGALRCVPQEDPSGEVCNGLDDDCDGTDDNGCPVSITTQSVNDADGPSWGGGGEGLSASSVKRAI